ncbi:hypothetical protein ACQPW1_09930 [Nocardia sp. CA-128927]|uniref:hypothetical protein n=1 Tax=Nocardia sp. CA-128927 TaxID=3239975 RepID=UPI003D9930C6
MSNLTHAELTKARTWLDETIQRLGWSIITNPILDTLKKELDDATSTAQVRDKHRDALAKQIWDGPARTRTAYRSSWNDLTDTGKTAARNSLDQILDVIEKAGWTAPPATKFPATILPPRTWNRLALVPTNLAVKDKNGNVWRNRSGRWASTLSIYGLGSEFTPDTYAPFTDVR